MSTQEYQGSAADLANLKWPYRDSGVLVAFSATMTLHGPFFSCSNHRLPAHRHLSKSEYLRFYYPEYKKMISSIATIRKVEGVILDYIRGCEGPTVGVAEKTIAPAQARTWGHDL
jgi:hypothetical protein